MRVALLSAFASTFALAALACVPTPDDEHADDTSSSALASYRVDVAGGAAVAAGSTAHLTLRVFDPNGQRVTAFDDLHTMPMHFVAVSSDLQDFMHLHPTLQANGDLTVDAPIAVDQPYKMFFEYDPKGPAEQQTSRGELSPLGAAAVSPGLASQPAFDGSALRATTVDDTRVELQPLPHAMIMSGMNTTFRVSIKTSAGTPATDLVDWMGMPGHAIILSEDTSTFIHAHGMPAGMGGHGGHGGHDHGDHGTDGTTTGATTPADLDVDVTIPTPGLYKMFMQVKRGDRVITAPFVLHATTM
jgi:hypothetical protein